MMDWRPFLLVALAIGIAVASLVVGFIVKDGRRRLQIALVSTVLVAAAMVVAWQLPAPDSEGPEAHAPDTTNRKIRVEFITEPNASAEATRTPTHATTHDRPVMDHGARFRAATNYFDFVRETRPAAMAGDPRAQVYLYRALKSCSTDYQYLFKNRKRYLSYEEGMQQAAKRLPYRPEYARLVHARCHGLCDPLDPDVENPDEWLRRAVQARDPLALAMVVGLKLRTPDAGDQHTGEQSGELDAAKVALARRQMGTAIRSRDPEVIFEMAHKVSLFEESAEESAEQSTEEPTGESRYTYASWMLAACRGLDCSASGESVRGFCLWDRNCQPYETVPDILQRHTGAGFPSIEARAREINQLLDAGKWEELGLGETLDDEPPPAS